MEQFRIKGTSVILNLAKNPAGFNQNISAVMQDRSPKDVIIAINDNAQDESIYPGFGMSILTVSAMKVYVLLPSVVSVVRICVCE